MADIIKMNPEQEQEYLDWFTALPPHIQDMVRKNPPTKLYKNKPAGNQRVTILSYEDDGTMTVVVLGKYNACAFERRVFGVSPNDLEECDLPQEGEPVGAVLEDQKSIDNFINVTRPFVLAGREKQKREKQKREKYDTDNPK